MLKLAFKIPPSNICLVGRWLCYLPEGTFKHANIATAPPQSAESTVDWIAHHMIGITFAIVFVAFAGDDWLQHSTPLPEQKTAGLA